MNLLSLALLGCLLELILIYNLYSDTQSALKKLRQRSVKRDFERWAMRTEAVFNKQTKRFEKGKQPGSKISL